MDIEVANRLKTQGQLRADLSTDSKRVTEIDLTGICGHSNQVSNQPRLFVESRIGHETKLEMVFTMTMDATVGVPAVGMHMGLTAAAARWRRIRPEVDIATSTTGVSVSVAGSAMIMPRRSIGEGVAGGNSERNGEISRRYLKLHSWRNAGVLPVSPAIVFEGHGRTHGETRCDSHQNPRLKAQLIRCTSP